jgi:phosphopantothenoylcysteine decarboxylase/phosphopantothenate--cysteine ligase
MRILVGITGGIAAYKSAELIRLFVEAGHDVRVVPTSNALRFIGAATLEALSHNPIHSELYDDVNDVRHVEMAHWAELIVVAPATASFLARTSAGLADDLLGNIIMASKARKLFAPAMHTEMWTNEATVANVEILESRGIQILEPASGRLTGNDTGVGRLPEAKEIFDAALFGVPVADLSGKRVLVIAGGTREPLDAVRYIGNRSSGKQGIALAQVAKARGAEVTLIAANIAIPTETITRFEVETVRDLEAALSQTGTDFDYILMPAAISDYRPAHPVTEKLKKSQLGNSYSVELLQNPDVISGIVSSKLPGAKVVGFAAETASGSELLILANSKLKGKGLDFVVANDVSGSKAFDKDFNEVSIVSAEKVETVAGSKIEIANVIFDLLLSAK